MLSLVVDRDHAKGVRWITVLLGQSHCDCRRFVWSATGTQEIAKEIRRTKKTQIPRCENVGTSRCNTEVPPDPFLDASILLVKGIDSVADGHAYHGNIRENARHKITTHQQTPATCAEQVPCPSLHVQVQHMVRRDCAVESVKHKCNMCNL